VALQFTEGFGWTNSFNDLTTYGQWGQGGNYNPSIGSNGPLGDNYAVISGDNASLATRGLIPSVSQAFVGCRVQWNGKWALQVGDIANGTQMSAVFDGNAKTVTVYRGSYGLGNYSGTVIVPAVQYFWSSDFNYFEFGGLISATAGTATVRINGATIIDASGLNNQGAANGTLTMNTAAWGDASNNGINMSLAHVYWCDTTGGAPWNGFLGDVRVQTLKPTANSAVVFTPTPGTDANWQVAATVPPSPTTIYNSDTTDGATDLFTIASMDPSLGTVFGVNVKGIYLKSASGNRSMAGTLKSGTASATGASLALGTNGAQWPAIFETDPATAAAWTQAAVNAAVTGYTITA
jgi:hypothetical protein